MAGSQDEVEVYKSGYLPENGQKDQAFVFYLPADQRRLEP
jgi:hypothetical protein